MANIPKVSLKYSLKNLLAAIAVIDGIAGIIGTVATAGLKGVPKQIFSLSDAEDAGFTALAEPTFHKHLSEFYNEVGGNQELWIMGVDEAKTLKDMLTDTDLTTGVKLLKAANGKIRLLGAFRVPPVGYAAGADFFDTDVEDAVTASATFCQSRLSELIPMRVLIEGRIADETSITKTDFATFDNGFAGVVVGDTVSGAGAAIGLALGRAVKFAAHIKLGKVKNGPLSVTDIYIGTKKLSEFDGLEALHGLSVISFLQHPNKAGFYFGKDYMCTSLDDRRLVYGRVLDKAAIIAAANYVEELEDEVDINADGTMNELDIEHLKGNLVKEINKEMSEQISSVSVFIDPKQDIINTEKLLVKVKVTPKGYTSEIEAELGLIAPSVA